MTRWGLVLILAVLVIFNVTSFAFAVEEAHVKHEAQHIEHELEHAEHEEHEAEHGAAPLPYYLQWGLLLFTFGVGLNYALRVRRLRKLEKKPDALKLAAEKLRETIPKKIVEWMPPTLRPILIPKHEGLAYLFTALVVVIFALGYHPSMEGYHEPPILVLPKFILLGVSGLLVMLYGVLGRLAHEEHEEEEHGGHAPVRGH